MSVFLRILLIFAFLIGGNFSCSAFIGSPTPLENHIGHHEEKKADNCCPDDKHNTNHTNLEGRSIEIQKEKYKPVTVGLSGRNLSGNTSLPLSVEKEITRIYCQHYDRHAFFFTKTIRLLI